MRSENDRPLCHRGRPWRWFQKVPCYAAVTAPSRWFPAWALAWYISILCEAAWEEVTGRGANSWPCPLSAGDYL